MYFGGSYSYSFPSIHYLVLPALNAIFAHSEAPTEQIDQTPEQVSSLL